MSMIQFFKDDAILVTGASGLVGRNLFELLKKEGCNVIGTRLNKEIEELTYCDLTDKKQVDDLIPKYNIKYVFMIAAKTYGAEVLSSNPSAMVMDTVAMNANVLDAAYRYKVKKLMYVSSSVVYQDSFKPLAEDDLDWNKDPFHMYIGVGWVKRYIEKLCQFYASLGLKINIVRPTNIYGKYDKYEQGKSHFIPAIIKRVLENQDPLVIWGKGTNIKNITYIDDFLRDMLKVFMNYDGVDPFNICSDYNVTIKEIVDAIIALTFSKAKPIYDSTKPDSVPYKVVLRNKLDTLLGRESYYTIYEGLVEVIDWMKQELKI